MSAAAGRYARGQGAVVEVVGDSVRIRRRVVVTHRMKEPEGTGAPEVRRTHEVVENTIPLAEITAVRLKEPGTTPGHITFNRADAGAVAPRRGVTYDENSVTFTNEHLGEFLALKEHVEGLIGRGVDLLPAATSDVGPPPALWSARAVVVAIFLLFGLGLAVAGISLFSSEGAVAGAVVVGAGLALLALGELLREHLSD